jgi:hypothetical protein
LKLLNQNCSCLFDLKPYTIYQLPWLFSESQAQVSRTTMISYDIDDDTFILI